LRRIAAGAGNPGRSAPIGDGASAEGRGASRSSTRTSGRGAATSSTTAQPLHQRQHPSSSSGEFTNGPLARTAGDRPPSTRCSTPPRRPELRGATHSQRNMVQSVEASLRPVEHRLHRPVFTWHALGCHHAGRGGDAGDGRLGTARARCSTAGISELAGVAGRPGMQNDRAIYGAGSSAVVALARSRYRPDRGATVER